MGLATEIPTDYGVLARYFNQHDVVISFKEKRITVSLNGYASQELRDANAQPIKAAAVTLAIGDTPVLPGRVRRIGNPEFMPEGEAEEIVEPVRLPSVPIEVIHALQAALYDGIKTTELFGGSSDA